MVTHGVTMVTHGVSMVTHGVSMVTHGVTMVTHGVTMVTHALSDIVHDVHRCVHFSAVYTVSFLISLRLIINSLVIYSTSLPAERNKGFHKVLLT